MLKMIVVYLRKKWKTQEKHFAAGMQSAGFVCLCAGSSEDLEMLAGQICSVQMSESNAGQIYNIHNTILITDDRSAAGSWRELGGVCIGCTEENGFFHGAEMVTDSLESLDETVLEETLLHGLGLPVTVALTERLIIREITKDDVERLYQISMQDGMEHLMGDRARDNCFEPGRMLSYIKNVYRFYGYGLWSVWTKHSELIGCCGLSSFERSCNSEVCLELQYMLDRKYQGKGYGLEMCSAALDYAFARTEWEMVYLRICRENRESIRLAQKLGFHLEEETGTIHDGEILLFSCMKSEWKDGR